MRVGKIALTDVYEPALDALTPSVVKSKPESEINLLSQETVWHFSHLKIPSSAGGRIEGLEISYHLITPAKNLGMVIACGPHYHHWQSNPPTLRSAIRSTHRYTPSA